MKKTLVAAAAGALMFSSAAFGQGTQGVTQEQIDEFITLYFDQFSSATSGRYVDDRCLHLSPDDHARLANNIEAAKRWLQTFVDGETLDAVDVGARQIGMDAVQMPCGPQSTQIVNNALQLSGNLAAIANDAMANTPQQSLAQTPVPTGPPPAAASDLTPEEQARVEAATESLIQHYETAILGWHVEQRCAHLGETLGAEYDSNKDQIEGYVRQILVFSALQQINRDVAARANSVEIPACGRETFDIVENSFRTSRQLLAYLKQLPW